MHSVFCVAAAGFGRQAVQPLPVPHNHPASLNIRDPDLVISALEGGAHANLHAKCRKGSTDVIAAPGELIATGDLHDNPRSMARLLDLAAIDPPPDAGEPPSHLLLHELIHPDELEFEGMDYSYRALVRAAAAKASFPEHVHTLLANHELAQIAGAGIVKNGMNVVKAFNAGVHHLFGNRSGEVTRAINAFIRSMPLAVRWVGGSSATRDVLCCHSLPEPDLLERFDPTILDRAWTDEDAQPRRGSAHLMVWGRGHDQATLDHLADEWNVGLFILGHEKAEHGALPVGTNAIVLNTDHDNAVYVPLDLSTPVDQQWVWSRTRKLFD